MVYPLRKPSNESVQNALLNYLNLNRHKFDEYGNFDSRPDRRDYVPFVLAKAPPPTFTWGPGGPRSPKKPGKWWFDLNNPKNWNKQNDEVHQRRRGFEFSGEECDEHKDDAMATCARRWLRTDIRIPERAYEGCIDRAKWLWSMCNQKKRYTNELKEWGWEDSGVDDVQDYLDGGLAPNEVRPDAHPEFDEKEKEKGKKKKDSNSDADPFPNYDPYSFSPPWGAPAIYRAPLMPPELQRKIPRGTAMTPEERELVLQLARSLALSFLFKRLPGGAGIGIGRPTRLPSGGPIPAPR